jgi:hypothetical protein
MKKILTLLALMFCTISYTQTTQINTLAEQKISGIEYSVKQIITDKDTAQFIVIYYKNLEYQHITDNGSIMFHNKKDVTQFIEALTGTLEHTSDNFFMVNFNKGYITKSKDIIIITNNEKQWHRLRRNDIEKIIQFLQNNSKYLKE